MTIITSLQGDTLDAAVYRHYGDNNMIDAALSANPSLSAMPLILPEGTKIFMPAKQEKTTRKTLW